MSIASEIQRLQTAKADIKTAIEAKGVTVPSSATIDTYDDYVSQITGGLTRETSGTSYCENRNLYYDIITEISIDGGTSWVESGRTQILIESGSTQCPRLPIGYTEVQYIQNTGTSYLDTNFVPNQDSRIVADMQMVTQTSYWPRLWGAGAFSSANGLTIAYQDSSGTRCLQVSWFGETNWASYSSVVENTNRHIYDLNKNYMYVDEVLVGSHTYTTRTASDHLGIFTYIASGRPGSSSYWGKEHFLGKMYSFQVYDNGTLVRDLVPCIRDNDNTVGAYDLVNDVFYTVPTGYTTNQLVAGPIV